MIPPRAARRFTTKLSGKDRVEGGCLGLFRLGNDGLRLGSGRYRRKEPPLALKSAEGCIDLAASVGVDDLDL
jgi:hypothetical protein